MSNVIPNILTICFGEWTGSVTMWHRGTGEPLEPPSSGLPGWPMLMVYPLPAQRLVYPALGRCLKPFTGLKSAGRKVPDPSLTKASLTWPCSSASFWTMTSHSLHKQVLRVGRGNKLYVHFYRVGVLWPGFSWQGPGPATGPAKVLQHSHKLLQWIPACTLLFLFYQVSQCLDNTYFLLTIYIFYTKRF